MPYDMMADLPPDVNEVLTDMDVKAEWCYDLIHALDYTFTHARALRVRLLELGCQWLVRGKDGGTRSIDTQLRVIRLVRDATNLLPMGVAVISENRGYRLAATGEEVRTAADRVRAMRDGMHARYLALLRVAREFDLRDGKPVAVQGELF